MGRKKNYRRLHTIYCAHNINTLYYLNNKKIYVNEYNIVQVNPEVLLLYKTLIAYSSTSKFSSNT